MRITIEDFDEDGNPLVDEWGNPVLDEAGNPIYNLKIIQEKGRYYFPLPRGRRRATLSAPGFEAQEIIAFSPEINDKVRICSRFMTKSHIASTVNKMI